ncbi:hypothetical protein L6164_000349 [Bauhinia variegata]|uniref:Uncharacterized protein n=1 Tax=Bauhinia variegata TaxID=167791 RepID=A0ACB9Q681_BAUVA|nr:hypothetical protein L6164_000349 [Bauhinia variegata]
MAALAFRFSLFFLLSLWVSPIPRTIALTCTSQKFTDNQLYSKCLDLPVLDSYLHYTYDSSNSSLSFAFIAAPAKSDGWISWAINPTGDGMAGAQALVAFKNDGVMTVNTYNISSYSSILPSKLSFDVWDMKAEESDGVMRILAKVKVPTKAETLNQVWQVGPSVIAGFPGKHGFEQANLQSKGTLSLNGEQSSFSSGVDSRMRKKNIHGILNTVSWGILFPLGVIFARYVKHFPSADPAWFYMHVSCQVSAYAIGVAGWATGLKLGSELEGIQYSGHRNIGITLFCFATLQIVALFLRPNKDHKFRIYWNIYHHSVGYSTVVLGIINIFKGFEILNVEKKWKSAYIVVIAALGGIAILLEVITWILVLRRKSRKSAV